MKIILDANVIIAAFAARGLCAEIFRFSIESCEVFASTTLLDECEKTLIQKLKIPTEKVSNILLFLEKELYLIEPAPVATDACRDSEDLHILGVALQSQAQFIITGDKDLLVLESFRYIKIYTPRQFWTYIQTLRSSGE